MNLADKMTYNIRYERKYVLSIKEYYKLKNKLLTYFKPDIHGKNGKYIVSSLYYDTKELKMFYEKEDGEKNRLKVRLRTYKFSDGSNALKEGYVNLEIKKRNNLSVSKKKIFLNENFAKKIIDNSSLYMDKTPLDPTLIELAYITSLNKLVPIVVIIYEREAFFSIFGPQIRLTFDHNLNFRSTNLTPNDITNGLPSLPTEYIIMEIKYNTILPIYLTKLIEENSLCLSTFSKYYISMEKRFEVINKTGILINKD
jgi:hypothetical protein